ncbi:MAG: CDF family Co(II)/Ni(II) efflux transporter DmeF [Alphaproteobacteria bacterium]|nr:CDF family Co(II)/Ni(II) efflux transporter DmeF [Alphaproteobacteria bacterium]
MHIYCMDSYRHSHGLRSDTHGLERRIRWVMGLTVATMVAEIGAGWVFGSLALLADGWHMASHGLAMFIALFAYAFARRHKDDPRFTFGMGKVDALGGFASAIFLGMVALFMVWEALSRLFNPTPIAYVEALVVAAIGLAVNLVSVLILDPPGGHDHGHGEGHSMRATYLHVLADLLTSIGAILALAAGMFLSWDWLDPVVGMASALVIFIWARGLIKSASGVLLDEIADPALIEDIRQRIEADADNRIADLHLWSFEPGRLAVILSVVTHFPRPPEHYKALLVSVPGLDHVTIEVLAHAGKPCLDIPVPDRP